MHAQPHETSTLRAHSAILETTKKSSLYPHNIVGDMIRLGSWDVMTSRYRIEQCQAEHEEMRGLLHLWSRAFVREENYMRRYFGVPSLIVRADYFYKDGIKLCEIEERPAGIALTATINKTFRKRTQGIFETLEKRSNKRLALVISPARKGTSDDPYWANGLLHRHVPFFHGMPTEEARKDHLFFVRSDRTEQEYFDLTRDSVSSIAFEGDKSYGLLMNLWKNIGNPDTLPWSHGVVLKPQAGSRFEEVFLSREGKRHPGMHTVSRARMAIEEKRVAYWQPYFEPETPNFLNPRGSKEKIFMLRRAFWGLDPLTENWVSLGGLWMANPSVRIHGTPESLCGPLMPAR